MKFGCHAVLFAERIKSETEVVLKGLADTGFKGVEIGSRFFGTGDKKHLLDLLDKYGIQLTGMHVGCPLNDWVEKEEECIGKILSVAGFLQDMPNKNIVMSGSKAEDEDLEAIAGKIEKIAKRCLDTGIKINYHNHAWEFENNAKIFKALVKYAPSLYFGLDLGWVYKGGCDPVDILKEHASRVSYVHLRDAEEREDKEFVELGDGIFDYTRLMGILSKILGDDGWAVVEYETGEQDFERYGRAKIFLDGLKYEIRGGSIINLNHTEAEQKIMVRKIAMDFSNIFDFISRGEFEEAVNSYEPLIRDISTRVGDEHGVLGWIDIEKIAEEGLLEQIEKKAKEIREKADIFLLIGIGGSNQGARAVIEAMGNNTVNILYAGNNLSPHYLNKIISQLKGKSVYVNIIAKNFATLEPGIVFRVIRGYLEETYGLEEASKRIIATGSLNNSSLEILGRQKGYTLLPFPLDVGGRFSVFTAVGLLPVAVSGVDIRALLDGAKEMKKAVDDRNLAQNDAVLYAVLRNILLRKGYGIEIMSFFEPMLHFFSKWWIQLFGESEGKKRKGIFPTACSFSEDLHSLGQYIQEGQRILFETFLNIEDQGVTYKIPLEETDIDGFAYIEGQDFTFLNKTAYEATVKAHTDGGVPCIILNIPELTPFYMGQLFYFFEYSCYLSALILGVNPFDQPGVEAYKKNMFEALGKASF